MNENKISKIELIFFKTVEPKSNNHIPQLLVPLEIVHRLEFDKNQLESSDRIEWENLERTYRIWIRFENNELNEKRLFQIGGLFLIRIHSLGDSNCLLKFSKQSEIL